LRVRVVKKILGNRTPVGGELDIRDARVRQLIKSGRVEPVGEPVGEPVKAPEPKKAEREKAPPEPTNIFLLPPRHICACGFVAKSSAGLASHKQSCGVPQDIKLNLGCGEDLRDGFINVDLRDIPGVVRLDVSSQSLKTYRGVGHILARDIIEHFPQAEVPGIIELWVSLLEPGGTIEIQCPDIRHAMNIAPNDDWVIRLIYGGQDHEHNYHKAGFTRETMRRHLEEAGLEVEGIELTKHGNMIAKARKLCSL
jgi:predicted SAM-dependent methyltransferase